MGLFEPRQSAPHFPSRIVNSEAYFKRISSSRRVKIQKSVLLPLIYIFLLISLFLFVRNQLDVVAEPEMVSQKGEGNIMYNLDRVETPKRWFGDLVWSSFLKSCDCKYSSSLYSYDSSPYQTAVSENRQRIFAYVGIQTAFQNSNRREAIRNTWLKSIANSNSNSSLNSNSSNLIMQFVVGKSLLTSDEDKIYLETKLFNDFLRLDIYENYSSLNIKTLSFFRTVYSLYDADFYVKIDDDMYLSPTRLVNYLSKERSSKRNYFGCMTRGDVINVPDHKWFEPRNDIMGSQYFLHASGTFYALSNAVVKNIYNSIPDSLRMLQNEDVTVGAWMLSWGVDFEEDSNLCEVKCTDQSIAILDWPFCTGLCEPEVRMYQLHNNQTCLQ